MAFFSLSSGRNFGLVFVPEIVGELFWSDCCFHYMKCFKCLTFWIYLFALAVCESRGKYVYVTLEFFTINIVLNIYEILALYKSYYI